MYNYMLVKLKTPPYNYLLAILCIVLTSFTIKLLHADSSLINIPLFYLLSVQLIALVLGKKPAILASILAFLAFDFFFIEPKYIFTVSNPSEFLALCLFLTTSIIIGQLTAKLQVKAQEANQRELETASLARASLAIANEISSNQALLKVLAEIKAIAIVDESVLIYKNSHHEYEFINSDNIELQQLLAKYHDAIEMVFANALPINDDNNAIWHKGLNLPDTENIAFLPVAIEGFVHGVLYLKFNNTNNSLHLAHERKLINTLLYHAAVVLQRQLLFQEEANVQALAQAEKLKTTLLQMVSHDFRSPLASIKTSISNLLDESIDENTLALDDKTTKLLLNTIDSQTDRLNKLVTNIIDYSKLEANMWNSNRELIPITDFVSSILNSFSSNDNERIIINVDNKIKNLYIDCVQMVQAINNLLENALKYSSPDKPVNLNIILNDQYLDIIVSDRGSGLNQTENIYDLFYRGEEFQESSIPGIGMGLTIAKGLIEAHLGKLNALNNAGGGAQFRARFPFDINKEDMVYENINH